LPHLRPDVGGEGQEVLVGQGQGPPKGGESSLVVREWGGGWSGAAKPLPPDLLKASCALALSGMVTRKAKADAEPYRPLD